MRLSRLSLLLLVAWVPVQLTRAVVPVAREPRHDTKFENEFVRIFDIAIPPHESTLFHEHLVDNITVVLEGDDVTLQPLEGKPAPLRVEAGQVIFTGAPKSYSHRVANPGSSRLRMITVELLARPRGSGANAVAHEPIDTVVLENERVRAWRRVIAPGQVAATRTGVMPIVRVVQSGGAVVETAPAVAPQRLELQAGDWQWQPADGRRSVQNVGASRIVLVEFEIL